MAANRINLQNHYEEAVARFGVEQVEQGNEIMVEVEFAREALDRVGQGKFPSQHAASYRATLEGELARAANEALERNNEYLLDLARDDGDLAVAIGRARSARPDLGVAEENRVYAANLEALRRQFARTDFNYPYSDDPDARGRGREQVSLATEAFKAFAERSPAHAMVASAAWEKATDLITPPQGFVPKSQRTEVDVVSGNRDETSLEALKQAALRVVDGKINQLTASLSDRDAPNYISEDSYVTRNEAYADRQFFSDLKAQLEGLEPGGTLDLSRTETDYGYDPEEAYTDRMSGLEYEPAVERSRSEHEGHIEGVAPLLEQLRIAGITIDTSFNTVEPPSEAEQAAWDAERLAEINLEEEAFHAGQNGLPIPEGCGTELHLLRDYEQGLGNPVKEIENEAELRRALSDARAVLEEQARNSEALHLADSIVSLSRQQGEAERNPVLESDQSLHEFADRVQRADDEYYLRRSQEPGRDEPWPSKEEVEAEQNSSRATADDRPVPGSPEAPIHIGHTAEQQLRYATSEKLQREIMDNNPDPLPLFTELYEDVVRTADSVPIGALHRHAEGRLQQSYAVLALIEQGREIGLLPKEGEFVATGARVQDKRTSRMYPAAHRLPCDLSIKYDGQSVRLTDFFEEGLDKTWIDKNIFAPTDRIHRLANVADQWCEDGGMKTALVKAANAVLDGKMTARRAMDDIVQPGYAAAIATAREKVERNFSIIERQALSQRIVTIQGQPFRLPEPTALNVKGMSERAAAKDVMERTLAAYSHVSELSPGQRMQSAMAATGIIDNEKRAIAEGGRDRLLPPGMAAIEAEHARREARANLQREMDVIEQLAGKAREAAVAANDISRPLSARQSAMNDAMAYGDRMKVAWTALQKERGPQIVERMQQRVRHCGFHGQQQLAELRSAFAAPPRVVRAVAGELEDTKDSLLRESHVEQDRRAQERRENIVQFGPRPEF